jgi:hypothetical protein
MIHGLLTTYVTGKCRYPYCPTPSQPIGGLNTTRRRYHLTCAQALKRDRSRDAQTEKSVNRRFASALATMKARRLAA